MTYVLTDAEGDLDSDWQGSEIGEQYNECVSKHEMDFAAEMGEGPHSVYDSNKWYFNKVSKEEFFESKDAADPSMSFADWWDAHKDTYKGVGDWKDTKFTLVCTQGAISSLKISAAFAL